MSGRTCMGQLQGAARLAKRAVSARNVFSALENCPLY